jgi:outer membrane lipoprotein-sorting protein
MGAVPRRTAWPAQRREWNKQAGTRPLAVLVTALAGLAFLLLPGPPTGYAARPAAVLPPAGPIRSVQADFVQEKQLPILARPLRSRGILLFQAPDSLRWEYQSPVRSLLLLHRGRSRSFIDRDGVLVEQRNMAASGLNMILTELTGWLQGNFHDTATFQVHRDKSGGLIRLVPRKPGLRAILKEIDLEPGGRPGLLRSVRIVEDRDALTILSFSNVRINQPIAPQRFTQP